MREGTNITIATFIFYVFRAIETLILIDVVASWIRPQKDIPMLQVISSMVEPLLYPGRRLQERIAPNLPIDFSPFVAIIILDIIKSIILRLV
ncbi:MAG: YggT family protein [Clostridiales bacterium]|nr:YggT family protein [Clostridiales bacterium]